MLEPTMLCFEQVGQRTLLPRQYQRRALSEARKTLKIRRFGRWEPEGKHPDSACDPHAAWKNKLLGSVIVPSRFDQKKLSARHDAAAASISISKLQKVDFAGIWSLLFLGADWFNERNRSGRQA
jgi:hypothetical protein